VLTTDQKGAIAESAIAHEAAKLGVGVYRPLIEGGRYDLILEVNTQLIRVQCKWATLASVRSLFGATRRAEARIG
jgi:PD-(D/E)XK endonuclease